MNKIERVKMLKAMEFIARQINDERIFESWLSIGIADGDIPYGNFSTDTYSVEDLEYYCESDNFADIMGAFLYCMHRVYITDSGLYCDEVIDKRI